MTPVRVRRGARPLHGMHGPNLKCSLVSDNVIALNTDGDILTWISRERQVQPRGPAFRSAYVSVVWNVHSNKVATLSNLSIQSKFLFISSGRDIITAESIASTVWHDGISTPLRPLDDKAHAGAFGLNDFGNVAGSSSNSIPRRRLWDIGYGRWKKLLASGWTTVADP